MKNTVIKILDSHHEKEVLKYWSSLTNKNIMISQSAVGEYIGLVDGKIAIYNEDSLPEDVQIASLFNNIENAVRNIDAEYQGRQFLIFYGKDWVQVGTERPDTYTGEISVGKGGKAYVNENASENQIVKIVLGLILRYVEHEAREGFKWKGKRVFNPHLTIESLYNIIEESNYE